MVSLGRGTRGQYAYRINRTNYVSLGSVLRKGKKIPLRMMSIINWERRPLLGALDFLLDASGFLIIVNGEQK
jgi:hypothetical protein